MNNSKNPELEKNEISLPASCKIDLERVLSHPSASPNIFLENLKKAFRATTWLIPQPERTGKIKFGTMGIRA